MADGAFAMLAAPMAAAAENGHDPTKLISFFAQEMQQFFAHIQAAVRTYNASGELPQSLFKAAEGKRGRGAGKEKKEKSKRKPSAFNLFVRDKLEEFKAKGVKAPAPKEGEKQARNPLFSMAVAEWSKLSKEEKEEVTKKYAAQLEGEAHEEGGSAEEEEEEGGSSEEEEEEEEEESEEEPPKVEEQKKKKHKHHHH